MSSEENFPDEMSMPGSSELTNNPCWQDIYDDDCSMSNIYAANFVASKWIKIGDATPSTPSKSSGFRKDTPRRNAVRGRGMQTIRKT